MLRKKFYVYYGIKITWYNYDHDVSLSCKVKIQQNMEHKRVFMQYHVFFNSLNFPVVIFVAVVWGELQMVRMQSISFALRSTPANLY